MSERTKVRCPRCQSSAWEVKCAVCGLVGCDDCMQYGTKGRICTWCKDKGESGNEQHRPGGTTGSVGDAGGGV
jgi:hypothetical protein